MRRASWAVWSEALRRGLMTVAVSRVRWAQRLAEPSVPVSAAQSARSTAFSASPVRAATATTTATSTGAAIGTKRRATRSRVVRRHARDFLMGSILQPVSGLEDPRHHDHADDEEGDRHADAQGHADVGDFVEAPAEA